MSGRVAQSLTTTLELVVSDQAFLDGYDGVEVELPDGSTVICKVLTVERVAHYMRLYQKCEQGDAGAMLKMVDEFPRDVGLADDTKLTVGELFDLVRRFFSARRPKRPPEPPPTVAVEPMSPPTSDTD